MSWNPFKRRITSDGTVPPVHPSSPADDTKQTDEDTMADPAKTDEKTKAADPVTPAPPHPRMTRTRTTLPLHRLPTRPPR